MPPQQLLLKRIRQMHPARLHTRISMHGGSMNITKNPLHLRRIMCVYDKISFFVRFSGVCRMISTF